MRTFAPGTAIFTPTRIGRYKFVGWGAGGNGGDGDSVNGSSGGSGSYGEISLFLTPNQPVTVFVGRGGTAAATTLTVGGRVLTIPAGTNGAAGVAGAGGALPTGFDYALAGTNGQTSSGTAPNGNGPGGGAGGTNSIGVGYMPGPGAPGTLDFPGGSGGSIGTGQARAAAPGAGGLGSTAGGVTIYYPGADGQVTVFATVN